MPYYRRFGPFGLGVRNFFGWGEPRPPYGPYGDKEYEIEELDEYIKELEDYISRGQKKLDRAKRAKQRLEEEL